MNAWTSLGYVAVGLLLVAEVARSRLPRSIGVFAAFVVLEGFGSFLYHADATDLSQGLHDIPLAAMVAFIAGWQVGRLFGSPGTAQSSGSAAASLLGTIFMASDIQGVNAIVGVGVGIVVVPKMAARFRHLAPVWTLPLLVLTALALVCWVLGTGTSPVCEEDSWAQLHGVWHLLTALLALVWVDKAVAVAQPERPPEMLRRGTDRVDRAPRPGARARVPPLGRRPGSGRVPTGRPVLIVANHGNGFVDPIVVAAALGTLPRFLAKAALWKVKFARPFLALAGVLPIYRSSDGDRTSDNRSVFEACELDLARGSMVAIFPEGTTGDRAGLDRVRSGAARIALGALPMAPDLVIVPIGLAFESRVETRSRTVVMFGEPIVVAEHWSTPAPATQHEPDRQAVLALTEVIGDALEAVSPEFASVDEREILRAAARIERDDAIAAGIGRVRRHRGGRPAAGRGERCGAQQRDRPLSELRHAAGAGRARRSSGRRMPIPVVPAGAVRRRRRVGRATAHHRHPDLPAGVGRGRRRHGTRRVDRHEGDGSLPRRSRHRAGDADRLGNRDRRRLDGGC